MRFTLSLFAAVCITACETLTALSQLAGVHTESDLNAIGVPARGFINLNDLRSGTGFCICWTRHDFTPRADGSTREDKHYWLWTPQGYTASNIFTSHFTNKPTAEVDTGVSGRKDDAYWHTSEEGIVDIDTTTNGGQKIAASYAVAQLTVVSTMGFSIHWDVPSMKFAPGANVTGMANNLTDKLEGIAEYYPDGKLKSCFYQVPQFHNYYLLSYTYDNGPTNVDSLPSSITLSLATRAPDGKMIKLLDLTQFTIISISRLTAEAARLVGVPSPDLYKYALITNGATVAENGPLTPERLGEVEVEVKAASTPGPPQPIIATRIIAAVVLISILVATIVLIIRFQKRQPG